MTLSGQHTFYVRLDLLRLGASWNPITRTWNVPDDRADEAARLVKLYGYRPNRKPKACVYCGTRERIDADGRPIISIRGGYCDLCARELENVY